MAIVSYTYGFAFVANPKAASTSIESALSTYQERPDLDSIAREGMYTRRHITALDLRKNMGDQWYKLFTFAIIRHPHDWVASQITYNFSRVGIPVPKDRLIATDDIYQCCAALKDRRGQPASEQASQWAFVCNENRRPLVSRLIQLESLTRSWELLASHLHISLPTLRHLNTTSHPPASEWLSQAAGELVNSIWRDDLTLYLQASETASWDCS